MSAARRRFDTSMGKQFRLTATIANLTWGEFFMVCSVYLAPGEYTGGEAVNFLKEVMPSKKPSHNAPRVFTGG
jgi:hypothetical protein